MENYQFSWREEKRRGKTMNEWNETNFLPFPPRGICQSLAGTGDWEAGEKAATRVRENSSTLRNVIDLDRVRGGRGRTRGAVQGFRLEEPRSWSGVSDLVAWDRISPRYICKLSYVHIRGYEGKQSVAEREWTFQHYHGAKEIQTEVQDSPKRRGPRKHAKVSGGSPSPLQRSSVSKLAVDWGFPWAHTNCKAA